MVHFFTTPADSELSQSLFFYQVGRVIIVPLAFAAAIALVGSILIFPSTISSQFTTRLQAVLTPLISAIELHRTLLNTPFPTHSNPSSSSMDLTQYTQKLTTASASIKASEAALGPLAACARLMNSDLIYSRFSPSDFKAFQMMCRRMSGRANGLSTFFSLVGVGPEAEMGLGPDRSPDGSAHTLPHSPTETPVVGTSVHEGKPTPTPLSPHSIRSPSIKSPASSLPPRHPHHDHLSHSHYPLHASLVPRPAYDRPNKGHEIEYAVGAFESQRYMNLEATTLWDPNWEEWTSKSLQALGERWVYFRCFAYICLFYASFMN
jgi:Putative ER transporter, 6TM, N-terminal